MRISPEAHKARMAKRSLDQASRVSTLVRRSFGWQGAGYAINVGRDYLPNGKRECARRRAQRASQ